MKHYFNNISLYPFNYANSLHALINIFSPSKEAYETIGADLVVDLHGHWLPGVDDGAKTVAEGLELVRGLVELGYKKLIATPHIMVDRYANTPDQLRRSFRRFRTKVRKARIPVELSLGAEYMLDDGFQQLLEEGDLLTIHKNLVLVEMSCLRPAPRLAEYLFELQLKQYQPVLAHPERYGYYHRNLNAYEELKNAGVLFQLNILALTGYYGRGVAEVANKLLEKGWYDFAGTDIHHIRHVNRLKFRQVAAAGQLQNVVLR